MTASGIADIVFWEGDPNDCTYNHLNNTVTINVAGTYGIRAVDPADPNDPNDVLTIQKIDLGPSVSGTVTVTIAWDENGGNGAKGLWEMNITATGVTGILAELNIEEDLATTGDVVCDRLAMEGDVICENVIHNITVNDQLSTGSDQYGLIASGDIGGNVYVGKLFGDILVENGTIEGNITLGGVGLYTSGRIVTAGSYDHTITINNSFNGYLIIGGGLSSPGTVTITGQHLGVIDLGGDLVAPAGIFIHSHMSQPNESVPPSIRIRGTLDGRGGPVPIRIGESARAVSVLM